MTNKINKSSQPAKSAKSAKATKASKLRELESRIVDASAPASQPAAEGKGKGKAVAKAAPRRVSSTVGAPAFAIGQGCRPVSGARLFAYTAAWLGMFGLDSGKSAAKSAVVKVAGATAVAYHIKQGNMLQTAAGIELTAKGKSVFALRAVDEELKAAYVDVLSKGQPNAKVGAAKSHIVALAG